MLAKRNQIVYNRTIKRILCNGGILEMARTANVFTRVDPGIKEQAETVLDQLGISMATAMEIYLRQIALQRKIPFEIKLPDINKPIAVGSLTDEAFNTLMDQAAKSYADGLCMDVADFRAEMTKEIGL